MLDDLETLKLAADGPVLYVTIDAPPMNMLGPELVRDLVTVIELLDRGEPYRVVVFRSADPDYYISHVDVTKVAEYRQEAARLTGEASIGLMFRHLAASPAVSIAEIAGRTRGAGSEFVLGCDMRFAARGSAIFSQMEAAFGVIPGGGATQHLVRLMGRGRALEVLLSASDYDADLAERYGWVNRALEPDALGPFVSGLAQRIAGMPAAGHAVIKERVNAIALADVDAFRRDSDLFGEGVATPEGQARIRAAMQRGYQNREAEMDLGPMLSTLAD